MAASKLAGSALKEYFKNLLTTSGKAGNLATQQVLKAGTDKFMPGVTGKALNPFLRSSEQQVLLLK